MLPVFIIAQVSAVASQQYAQYERQRIAAGLPPSLPPPAKSPSEIAQDKRDDFIAGCCIWAYIIFGGAVFCAPPIMLVFVAIKLAFASKGVKWP